MPSACTKPDNKTSLEATETVKQCMTVVEKKVRNLEKRKGKLDGYRDRVVKGEELNQDQQEAIAKYDGVIQALELAMELKKSFQQMLVDVEKATRKQLKRDKIEKNQQDVARTKELLRLQSMLDNMGVDTVREDFKNGTRGAIVLSEKQLTQLDELYKLISPSKEGEASFTEQLATSSEHIVGVLEGKDKEVVGTTYKAMNELVGQINACGYFDNMPAEVEAEEPAATEEEAPAETPVKEEAAPQPSATGESFEFGSQEASQETTGATSLPLDTFQPDLATAAPATQELSEPIAEAPEEKPAPIQQQQAPQTQPSTQQPPQPVSQAPTNTAEAYPPQQQQQPQQDEPSFFTTAAAAGGYSAAAQRGTQSGQARGAVTRPFNEIVSSVQGNFNFLQDSELESLESSAHNLDPAVVAAHPMVPSVSQATDAGLAPQPSAYQTSSLLASDPVQQQSSSPFQDPTSQQSQSSVADALTTEAVAAAAAAASQSQTGLYGNQGFVTEQDRLQSSSASLDAAYSTEQTFSQSLMSQSLDSATAQHSISFGGSAPDQSGTGLSASQSSYSHSIDQTVGMPPSGSSDAGPQPIPLPNQTVPGQSIASANSAPNYGSSDSQNFGPSADSQTFSTGGDTQTGYGGADTAQGYGPGNNQGFGPNDPQNFDAQGMSADGQTYTLNPNANMFRSMLGGQPGGGPGGIGASGAPGGPMGGNTGSGQFPQSTTSYSSQGQDRKTFSQTAMQGDTHFSQGNYGQQSGGGFNNRRGYGGPASNNSGPPNRGGGGGRGGRGGQGQGGGMNNGFSRGGPRGGSSYGSGGGGGGRGGGGSNSGGYSNGRGNGGRGGSSMYQGYPPRNDYRPEGGYQGFSNFSSSSSSSNSNSSSGANAASSAAGAGGNPMGTGGYSGGGNNPSASSAAAVAAAKRGVGMPPPPRGVPRGAPGMRSGPPPRGGSGGGGMRGGGGRGGSSYGRPSNMQGGPPMNM